ncbi:MAG: hypothetical protein KGJ79_06440 [Alphaproteobacteria bacterium]|nr:hypothetical protein [Alphaproteobacteria bacterium]MDE2110762.1 hypothetical protein [Alphaproteobacteria bacterium]MDE2494567.1 hypothetical protein [Alphaproteobacteria bacterium]
MGFIASFHTFLREFLHHLDQYHLIQAAVIALFFGMATASIIGLFIVPAVAALVYIAADTLIPPLMHHTPIMMPAMNMALLQEGIALYIIMLVAMAVVFTIKKLILNIRG